ncbi:MAG: NUDIX domain-containing protein [Thermoplasmata archaeon]
MPPVREPFRPGSPIVVELAAGAVVVGPGPGPPKILLLHLADEDRWCFPKGHVEPGESLVDAALREVREETGLPDVRLGDEISEVSYRFFRPKRSENVLKVSVFFLGRATSTEVRPEELFDGFEWVPLSAASERLLFETDRAVLTAAAATLRRRD